MQIDGKTSLYGIIGNPVSHSLSPVMHNAAFRHLGINCVYLPFPVVNIAAALVGIRHLVIRGVSVTIPYKETVIPHLDVIDPVAARIGAVNTILRLSPDGTTELHGSNTDWRGANRALSEKIELRGARVVLLGAGGSARAIGFGLIEAGAAITLCSRTELRGRQLADDLACRWHSLEDVAAVDGDILVNATSVGMLPGPAGSPLPAEVTAGFKVVMDIVYAPLQTRLLSDAAQAGCITINGLEMLLYQGVAQFELWTGRQAPVDVMRSVLMSTVTGVTSLK